MFENMSEEEITDYIIQMSIEESCQDVLMIRRDSLETASDENLKLLAAIDTGDARVIQELHSCPGAFKEVDSRGWLPLHRAAVQPMLNILENVLCASSEISLEEKTGEGETPLTLAVQAGLEENVRSLLEHGALPHNPNSQRASPLLLAVRAGSYQMAYSIIVHGAVVDQTCAKNWTAMHEAAKLGRKEIMLLLLRRGGSVGVRDNRGVTPLAVAAEWGHEEILEILIRCGADVNAQARNGESVLMDAAGSGNPDCVGLLLENGATPNQASLSGHLPIHRAAYEGHYLVLKMLIPLTSKKALRLSGQSPVHSAADGGHAQCLELLIESDFDVNYALNQNISEQYSDMRRTALYFAVSNGDVTCTEILLNAGAETELDPLRCLLVAVRAGRYEIVKLLLAKQADVNCYFTVVSDTLFPTALQYCLRDEMMMRLLLNGGYAAEKCFHCDHDYHFDIASHRWEIYKLCCVSCSDGDKIPFCDFMSLSCLVPLSGKVVRILLDYVSHVPFCSRLKRILEKQEDWPEICRIMGNPRSLKHLCRLVIRKHMTLKRLNDSNMKDYFPPRLQKYLLYKEYDLYDSDADLLHQLAIV
ncbi:ankyrin repeat and SOCS box protein 15-like [Chanos chanos]|uniref:Ankyrin repeat and SOCS box protein 15-like n=1 Tax=Chanos chanos TaxID=29144 RepID=A0A6J2ULN1_CHACN|nr:ankyrin repeat and SOCS box protein 15-like [Chanos chanos]